MQFWKIKLDELLLYIRGFRFAAVKNETTRMKKFLENLSIEINQKIKDAEQKTFGNEIEFYIQVISIIQLGLNKLKIHFLQQNTLNEKEEIEFFKIIKPQLTSKLIFYNELYNIEYNKPLGSIKTIRKYYKKEIKKKALFFIENKEFYQYYTNNNNYLDYKYFTRNSEDLKLSRESFYFIIDKDFTTFYDYKVALILANENLLKQLNKTINNLKNDKDYKISRSSSLNWTGSKVGIIELVYALHTEGVFNHGASEIKDIVYAFSKAFNIEINQFHRTFYEICARKSDQTKFLNSLKNNLSKRINQADSYY